MPDRPDISPTEDLLGLLTLERLERNLFRGESRDIGSRRVFGGQVLAQALSAAYQTVTKRVCHSLHGYFVRPGDINFPIVFDVDRARDGLSFSNRRVVAIQHGKPILNMAASFQAPEGGLEHQSGMPDVPPPESLAAAGGWSDELPAQMPVKMRRFLKHTAPFEFRPVERWDYTDTSPRKPLQHFWFRTVEPLPDDPQLHCCLMTYVSDYYLVGTAMLPHGLSSMDPRVQLASLDHAMWFHHPARMDQWLLFVFDSPSAAGARGLARGSVYTREGRLVCSTAQEGLMRVRDEQAAKDSAKR